MNLRSWMLASWNASSIVQYDPCYTYKQINGPPGLLHIYIQFKVYSTCMMYVHTKYVHVYFKSKGSTCLELHGLAHQLYFIKLKAHVYKVRLRQTIDQPHYQSCTRCFFQYALISCQSSICLLLKIIYQLKQNQMIYINTFLTTHAFFIYPSSFLNTLLKL